MNRSWDATGPLGGSAMSAHEGSDTARTSCDFRNDPKPEICENSEASALWQRTLGFSLEIPPGSRAPQIVDRSAIPSSVDRGATIPTSETSHAGPYRARRRRNPFDLGPH